MSANSATRNYRPSLKERAQAELELRRRQRVRSIPATWQDRVPLLFARYFWYKFSQPHRELWNWADAIDGESKPRPLVAIWPRGRGKSTTAEAIVADLGVRKARHYALYVSGTQDQADKHVMTIAHMLESDSIATHAPDMAKPLVSKNGNRQWNRQVLSTATGYTVEAIGLNKAVRGQKIDWARPNLIVFDDVDERHDSKLTMQKKREIITTSILPAGAINCAVLFVQNLIHADSIASQLIKSPGSQGAADFLMQRLLSGPFPAVENFDYELQQDDDLYRWKITSGLSHWSGFDLSVCETELNRYGPQSFMLESQHDVDSDSEQALLDAEDFERTRVTEIPDLTRVAIAVDPPGGATECGIVAGGKAKIKNDWHVYILEDASQPHGCKPEQWALAVLQCYYRHKADVVFVERNYGGDMVVSTIRQTKWLDADGNVLVDGARIAVREVVATRGKAIRAEPVAIVFQQGRGHHVGYFPALEKEWRQWEPGKTTWSPNRVDAAVWLCTGLGLVGSGSLFAFGGDT